MCFLKLFGYSSILFVVPLVSSIVPYDLNNSPSSIFQYSFSNKSDQAISFSKIRFDRTYPIIPSKPKAIARRIIFLENFLLNSVSSDKQYKNFAHEQQVIYRVLSEDLIKSSLVLKELPLQLIPIVESHLNARRHFLTLSQKYEIPNLMPAWRIVPPEPLISLLSYYLKAEENSGIDWEILAAINLVETGMGRISGVSVANAKGPMQFLQTTWDLPGIGNGDINDPHDSIQAAARYLVSRGGLIDIKKGLWGYNNSKNYVEAVIEYSSILKNDPRALKSFYNWEIHYRTAYGDLWLPVGYEQTNKIPISTYLKQFPTSSPPVYPSVN